MGHIILNCVKEGSKLRIKFNSYVDDDNKRYLDVYNNQFKMVEAKGLEKGIVQLTNPCMGLVLLSLNTILPGSGTIVSSCMDKEKFNLMALMLGILQMGLAILVVGWLWSIFHGYSIYAVSCELSRIDNHVKENALLNTVEQNARRLDEGGIASEAEEGLDSDED